jgi:hypothetical protein
MTVFFILVAGDQGSNYVAEELCHDKPQPGRPVATLNINMEADLLIIVYLKSTEI